MKYNLDQLKIPDYIAIRVNLQSQVNGKWPAFI